MGIWPRSQQGQQVSRSREKASYGIYYCHQLIIIHILFQEILNAHCEEVSPWTLGLGLFDTWHSGKQARSQPGVARTLGECTVP